MTVSRRARRLTPIAALMLAGCVARPGIEPPQADAGCPPVPHTACLPPRVSQVCEFMCDSGTHTVMCQIDGVTWEAQIDNRGSSVTAVLPDGGVDYACASGSFGG